MDEPSLRAFLATGGWRQRARWAARTITPWGIEWWLWKRSRAKARHRIETGLVSETPLPGTRVEEAIGFLLRRGLDEVEVREGSMPAASLAYISETVSDRLPSNRPIHVLHVGNFVGVSLCYVSWLAKERHPESLVVSIDPNIAHRGIENPQSHAVALLDHFQLLSRNLIITAYTLERSEDFATEATYMSGLASENSLNHLHDLHATFDLVVIDGNHEQNYLAREIDAMQRLLAPGGIVVFDDIGGWPGVAEVFRDTAQNDNFAHLGEDGRVGILQARTSEAALIGRDVGSRGLE